MSAPTITYRVYCFDAARNVLTAEEVNAASDADAIARVEAAGFGSKCEIWNGDRMIFQLEDERRQA